MDPYEASPEKIPATDRYVAEPLYGRYAPQEDDFMPDVRYVNSYSKEALDYWATILRRCDSSVLVYDNVDGGRVGLALGSIIVKSSHRKEELTGRRAHRDYSFADKNEVQATALVRDVLGDVRVPEILFAGKIDGRDVLVQERIPGVGLNVAWQYLSMAQKQSFKTQAKDLLRKLQKVQPPSAIIDRSYITHDPDPVQHRGIQPLEKQIIFAETEKNHDLSLMHNDFTQSNTIVHNDKIVGLVDWEMAGYFGLATAGKVHKQIRSPRRENYAALNLSEELLDDIMFWSDLYD